MKLKYRLGTPVLVQKGDYLHDFTKSARRAGAYRERTGPRCCNAGCGRRNGSRFASAMQGIRRVGR